MEWISEVPDNWVPLAMLIVLTGLLSGVFLKFWKFQNTRNDALIDKLLAAMKENAKTAQDYATAREEKMLEVLSKNTESRVQAAGKWETMTEAINRLMSAK